jgi:hypothetical protein
MDERNTYKHGMHKFIFVGRLFHVKTQDWKGLKLVRVFSAWIHKTFFFWVRCSIWKKVILMSPKPGVFNGNWGKVVGCTLWGKVRPNDPSLSGHHRMLISDASTSYGGTYIARRKPERLVTSSLV